ncbi:hypothetical protein KXV68_001348 [Aspergillus fumigatus]|nr:hypothetical protein CNMCM8714_008006 [Aspergillus fumigatus]KAF4275170.1 hypothetical protein CNMCM8812_002670 [Aspergillus fumigatus]KAH1345636.1 hypothetical protein KXX67_000491 [Aspergillus fumigatus]KAH1707339.1 hypothetical protein KXX23_005320 [Aspergillus fumigatus]KAH1736656.1 hypothetical protein KXX40_006534 [Aspergillus fumigatus]
MGGASCCPIPWPSGPRVSRETTHNDTAQDEDDLQLLKLGYRAELARAWVAFDNVTFSFAALHCIGGIRVFFYIVLSAGGPAAMYVLMIIVFVDCNSQYEGGAHGINLLLGMPFMRRRQGCRFVSFLAAALTLVAWTSFLATDSFGVANYAISHVVFLAGFIVVVIDILLNRIWLPIGVSKTYGFRPAEYGFTSTYNGGAVSSVSTHLAILPKKQSRPGNPPPTESFGRPWPHRYAVSIIILFLFCMPTIETFHDAVNILAGLSGGREYESNHQSFIQIIVVTLAIPIVGLHG